MSDAHSLHGGGLGVPSCRQSCSAGAEVSQVSALHHLLLRVSYTAESDRESDSHVRRTTRQLWRLPLFLRKTQFLAQLHLHLGSSNRAREGLETTWKMKHGV